MSDDTVDQLRDIVPGDWYDNNLGYGLSGYGDHGDSIFYRVYQQPRSDRAGPFVAQVDVRTYKGDARYETTIKMPGDSPVEAFRALLDAANEDIEQLVGTTQPEEL